MPSSIRLTELLPISTRGNSLRHVYVKGHEQSYREIYIRGNERGSSVRPLYLFGNIPQSDKFM